MKQIVIYDVVYNACVHSVRTNINTSLNLLDLGSKCCAAEENQTDEWKLKMTTTTKHERHDRGRCMKALIACNLARCSNEAFSWACVAKCSLILETFGL